MYLKVSMPPKVFRRSYLMLVKAHQWSKFPFYSYKSSRRGNRFLQSLMFPFRIYHPQTRLQLKKQCLTNQRINYELKEKLRCRTYQGNSIIQVKTHWKGSKSSKKKTLGNSFWTMFRVSLENIVNKVRLKSHANSDYFNLLGKLKTFGKCSSLIQKQLQ